MFVSPHNTNRRSLGLLMASMVGALLLSGCSRLGPDFVSPDPDAPDSWSAWHSGAQETSAVAIDTDRPSGQWWNEFDDPILDDLQQRLIDAGPDLQSAALNFTRSRLQRRLADSARGVDVNAGGGVSRQKLSEYGTSTRMASISAPANKDTLISALAEPYSLYQLDFDAGWEPDLWGRISRSIESAQANSEASAALLAQTRLGLSAELARAYFELRATQRQIVLLDGDITLAEDQLRLLEANREAGLVTESEVEDQRLRLSELRASLPSLKSASVITENAIATMLGERPGGLGELLTPEAATEEGAHMADLSLGVPSELARRRPDIRAAEAKLHAATAEIGVATADLYPRVTLTAGFGFESFEEGAFGDWGSHRWSIGPGFYLPIFNQGRLKTRVALTEVAQQQAAVEYQQAVLKAWQEVDNALSNYSAEQTRYRQLERKLASAQAQRQLTLANATAGLTDARAVLQAESQVLGVERQLVQSSTALKVQRVAIYKAIGGGLEGPEGLVAEERMQ